MPTDLPPDYKPAPPRDPDTPASPQPGGGPGAGERPGVDTGVGSGGLVPQPGADIDPTMPGLPGSDIVVPGGTPAGLPVF